MNIFSYIINNQALMLGVYFLVLTASLLIGNWYFFGKKSKHNVFKRDADNKDAAKPADNP